MGAVFDTVVAIVCAALAVGIIYVVVRAVCSAFTGNPRAWLETLAIRRRERLVAVADELMRTNHRLDALRNIRAAFFLEHPLAAQSSIERSHAHNVRLLSRLIGDAHSRSHQIDNLPILEDLLASREQLLSAFIEHVLARNNLTNRRRRDRKDTPAWAIAEFSKKIEDIADKLTTNRHSIESQLDTVIEELRRLPEIEEVTVH